MDTSPQNVRKARLKALELIDAGELDAAKQVLAAFRERLRKIHEELAVLDEKDNLSDDELRRWADLTRQCIALLTESDTA